MTTVQRTRTPAVQRTSTKTTTLSTEQAGAVQPGIAVIDKPQGWTSHQVVGRVRKLAGTRKVGHAGTLDPMATGVLVVGINRATRLLGYLSGTSKTYTATIRLGQATVTDDAEGEVVTATGAEPIPTEALEAALDRLRGDIVQVPSSVSAIKINGVRSYAKVRAGEQVDLVGRPVRITRFDCLLATPRNVDGLPVVDLDVVVDCSSGTYIRALARDLGIALGTGGHLTALRRTRVGPFDLQQAQTLEEAAAALTVTSIDDVARRSFGCVQLDAQQSGWVRSGRRLPGLVLPAAPSALMSEAGEFLALYRQSGPDAVAEAVFV